MTQENSNKALWGGRFEGAPEEFTQRFGASLPVDKRLWREDIAGSIAHAHMLGEQGVLSKEDVDAIVGGLKAVGSA